MLKFFPLIIAVFVGVLTACQPAINALLRGVIGSALLATIISFAVGLIGLTIAFGFSGDRIPAWNTLPPHPWWYWIGGIFGAVFVLCAVVVLPKIGAVMFFSCVVAGQLASAVIIDHYGLLGVPVHPLSFFRILGITLAVAGVVLVRIF